MSSLLHTPARWAKARGGVHRLAWHGIDAAAVIEAGFARRPEVADRLADLLGLSRDDACALVLCLAALHDVGKAMASFQALDANAAAAVGYIQAKSCAYDRGHYGHDAAGCAMLEALRDAAIDGRETYGPPIEALASGTDHAFHALVGVTVAGHHGHPRGTQLRWVHFKDHAREQADLQAAAHLVRIVVALFGWPACFPTDAAAARASHLLAGLITLADWLASLDGAFAPRADDMPPAAYLAHARAAAQQLLDELQPALFTPRKAAPCMSFGTLFDGYTPTPMQAACETALDGLDRAGPVLLVIEDMTGAGKTEAADFAVHRLIAARQADGFYVGLPTMTTANRAFERRQAFIDRLWEPRVSRSLAHSRARFARPRDEDRDGAADAPDWFARDTKRALLTAAGIGTVDQALAAALRADHAGLRLLGLWGKALVIDEVHAYDAYMLAVLERLLTAHAQRGGSAVLLSATLPSRARDTLVAAFLAGAGQSQESAGAAAAALCRTSYPALTLAAPGAPPRLMPVDPVDGPGAMPHAVERVGSVAQAQAIVLAHAAAGRSVIWFRNTVDDAREAWTALCEAGVAAVLWHSRILPADRAAIETHIERIAGKDSRGPERRGQVVVATQVAEQSLDLDFDAVVTDLAPVDAIIQRIGRCRRHARDSHGTRIAGPDTRAATPVTLLAPDAAAPVANWFATLLPRAAHIYRDDARLWLGLMHLLSPDTIPARRRPGPLRLDADLKPLIETVYRPDDVLRALVPEPLRPSLDAASGARCAERAQAHKARLSFAADLVADYVAAGGDAATRRDDEDVADSPTRLGESDTLTLLFQDETGLRLAGRDSPDPVTGSQIRVPRLPDPDAAAQDEQRRLLDMLPPSVQDRLRWARLLVLRRSGGGDWRSDDGTGGCSLLWRYGIDVGLWRAAVAPPPPL